MNLGMLLDMAVDGFGDRVVIGPRDGGLTAQRLKSMAVAGAAAVTEAGADSIVYLAVNGPAYPVALFAASYAGVPLVPVNYRLGREQLDTVLANHPKAYTVEPEQWLELTATGGGDGEGFVDPESPAVIIYTSGSTAAPKGVVLRHQNLVSYVLGSVEFASAGPDDAALISVPPYHVAAVANAITNLYAGRRALVLEQFAPEHWLRLVRDEKVTNALVVPTMLKRILDAGGDLSVPSLRTLAYGGAPMPSPVIEQALSTWPDVDFVNAYGLTETSSTIAVLGPEDHRAAIASDDPAVRARLSCAGQVLPTVELQIRDPDGNQVDAGATGRIWVRGPQVAAEYLGSGASLDEQGFFDTRDEGHLDSDGYLFIAGRTDDTIIRGAENIAPAEIEDILLRHPAVSDAVVVGLPHEEWGQCIEAVVVRMPHVDVDEQQLREHVRASLRSSKTPDHIWFWDELPRTETGKLVRRNIVSRISEERAQI